MSRRQPRGDRAEWLAVLLLLALAVALAVAYLVAFGPPPVVLARLRLAWQ